jgi:hypothetical protein
LSNVSAYLSVAFFRVNDFGTVRYLLHSSGVTGVSEDEAVIEWAEERDANQWRPSMWSMKNCLRISGQVQAKSRYQSWLP